MKSLDNEARDRPIARGPTWVLGGLSLPRTYHKVLAWRRLTAAFCLAGKLVKIEPEKTKIPSQIPRVSQTTAVFRDATHILSAESCAIVDDAEGKPPDHTFFTLYGSVYLVGQGGSMVLPKKHRIAN